MRFKTWSVPAGLLCVALAITTIITYSSATSSSHIENKMFSVGREIATCQNNLKNYSYDSAIVETSYSRLEQLVADTSNSVAFTSWCPYAGTWSFATTAKLDVEVQNVCWICSDTDGTPLAVAFGKWYNSGSRMEIDNVFLLNTCNPYIEDEISGEFDPS